MEDPDTLQRRVTELEVKLAFAEDLLERLNRTVFEQQKQIAALAAQLVQLRDQQPAEGSAWRRLRDEIPPHY
ncbi:SlyX family protein [Verticiella sediminum]|uniref:SlyX family protein n=1 Tax=Verticiella sediminum TaxID=1247510 RepID=A0A556AJ67_9BURK|nr:SlyX family protein [Verticiella sediminum]TSH92921.1 SlyX family protein [Verticiella sediminum]